jgi:hydroxymethylpyrimidine pyrophosphatase-like HAD family hydrolase
MVSIAFDVDGTLICEGDVPRYDVINIYHFFEKSGCEMYIWSGSGFDYATRWSQKLGLLNAIIRVKGSFIPDIAIDDQFVNLGKVNIKV